MSLLSAIKNRTRAVSVEKGIHLNIRDHFFGGGGMNIPKRLAITLTVLLSIFTAKVDAEENTATKLRVADAVVDVCFANCANQNASCKRVCPTTLSAPCLSACDSQSQTCRLSCQNR